MPPWPGRGANLGDPHARGGAGDDSEGHGLARFLPAHAARKRGLLHARQRRQRGGSKLSLVPPARRRRRGRSNRGQRRRLGDEDAFGHGRAVEREGRHQSCSDEQKGEGKEVLSVHGGRKD